MLRGDAPVFIDWTDAAIGPPTLDLLELMGATDPALPAERREVYLEAWQPLAPRDRLEAAWKRNEIILPLHHCVSYRSCTGSSNPWSRGT